MQQHETPEATFDKLEQVLKGYDFDLQEVVPLFADLLSVPLPEGRYASLRLTPQQQKQQTLDAVMMWLMEETERQPVLAVWEDKREATRKHLMGKLRTLFEYHVGDHVYVYKPGSKFDPMWKGPFRVLKVEGSVCTIRDGADLHTHYLYNLKPAYLQEEDQFDYWVQCDSCDKWRLISKDYQASLKEKSFFCDGLAPY